ncbi:MAG: amidophosphoribosyltransferase [Planctomycetota bacterium]|nr:amidophosphoribosyltransferase [Planctomycetota bacterium]
MSDRILHECGLAMIRLRKDLDWYRNAYDDPFWGLHRLFLLMEKQHNRGQDGAGIGTVKFDMPPGDRFLERLRSAKTNPIERLFDRAMEPANRLSKNQLRDLDARSLKRRVPMLGEVLIGHLRYGTHGGQTTDACHPLVRRNNVASRNLALAGNFNLTNAEELHRKLVEYGLHVVGDSDTQAVMERIGYMIDREHNMLASTMGEGSFANLRGRELAKEVSRQLDLNRILRKATMDFDGGWVLGGLLGNGDMFSCRDPAGIRPAFMHVNEEVVAVASERPALCTVFNVQPEEIRELPPGHALVVKRSGEYSVEPYIDPLPPRRCTVARHYISRGNDRDIYRERKNLGRNLVPEILREIDGDLDHSVFGFIPNTAETAYLGMIEGLAQQSRDRAVEEILGLVESGRATREGVEAALRSQPRVEKIAQKDQRLRTFITHDSARKNLVGHVYDLTRGVAGPEDTLVVIDDSIVRGTTLRESIITMLSRLRPRKIVIASSAPPIMYPDCYGIDMSQLGRFIAFEAAVAMLRERGEGDLLEEIEAACLAQRELPDEELENHVRRIYEPFSHQELCDRIAGLIRSDQLDWDGEISVIYQTVEGLRDAMPGFTGDWYFTGDYPTPGGLRVLNTAYLKWRRNDESRAYESSIAPQEGGAGVSSS